jgi:predicted nuclease of predicted toxin-antitoxin system
LARAVETQRALVSEDKDFGELIVHQGYASGSVVLVRLDNVDIAERVRLVDAALASVEHANGPVLVVVAINNTRLRPILRSV